MLCNFFTNALPKRFRNALQKKVSYALQKRFHMLRKKRFINALPNHIFHICLSSAPFSFFSSSCLTFAHIFRHLHRSANWNFYETIRPGASFWREYCQCDPLGIRIKFSIILRQWQDNTRQAKKVYIYRYRLFFLQI